MPVDVRMRVLHCYTHKEGEKPRNVSYHLLIQKEGTGNYTVLHQVSYKIKKNIPAVRSKISSKLCKLCVIPQSRVLLGVRPR